MALDIALNAVTQADRDALMKRPPKKDPVSQADPRLVKALQKIFGTNGVSTAGQDLRPYAFDQCWLSLAAAAAGKSLGKPDVVVRPQGIEHVSAALKLANEWKVPVTPWGGGSGVQGAGNPDQGGIVIDLRSMKKIRLIDTVSMTATVDAGIMGDVFENTLNKRDLTCTHLPASIHVATVGGYLAARGSGVLSNKYGKIEDHVLNIEGVLPTGEIFDTVSVPRHAMGPELMQLFIGSEGTLGVITGVTLKIRQQPAAREYGTYTFRSMDKAFEACRLIMTTGLRPPTIRLYDENSVSHTLDKYTRVRVKQPAVIMMFDGDYPKLVKEEAKAAFDICRKQGGKYLGYGPGKEWWERRYVYYYPPHMYNLPAIWGTMDVVMDYAHTMDVYRAMYAAMKPFEKKYGLLYTPHFSHWYEWGTMIYARFKIPQGPARYEDAVKVHDEVWNSGLEAAFRAGAVLNDHHGVGVRCAPFMERQLGGSFEILRRIKAALDPNNIMCPGKLGLGRRLPAAGKPGRRTARRAG
jgi:alkyldihydroxyacetonephosphate synthase